MKGGKAKNPLDKLGDLNINIQENLKLNYQHNFIQIRAGELIYHKTKISQQEKVDYFRRKAMLLSGYAFISNLT